MMESLEMMLYKFLDRRHVASLVRGTFKFGRLRYYRLLEQVTGDGWIGDRREGVAVTVLRAAKVDSSDPNDQEMRARLEAAGVIEMAPGNVVHLENVTIINSIDCFVLCFSIGNLEGLVKHMSSKDRGKYAYDACVSLTDADELEKRLWREGRVGEKRLDELFTGIRADKVRYGDWIEGDLGTHPASIGDPFFKGDKYRDQAEWRFVLYPRQQIEKDSVFVHCMAAGELLREEGIQSEASQWSVDAELATMSCEQIRSEMWGLWSTWDQKQRRFRHQDGDGGFEASVKHNEEMEGLFRADFRPRIQKLYFELRTRWNMPFPRIDEAIIAERRASVLHNYFQMERMFVPDAPFTCPLSADGASGGSTSCQLVCARKRS
jgi:hypothetical protein